MIVYDTPDSHYEAVRQCMLLWGVCIYCMLLWGVFIYFMLLWGVCIYCHTLAYCSLHEKILCWDQMTRQQVHKIQLHNLMTHIVQSL